MPRFPFLSLPPLTFSLSGALLLLLLLSVYLNAVSWANGLGGAFQFDDYNVIVDNAAVHSWSAWWQSMPGIRPLLKLSYTANWVLSPSPFGFHLVNLLIHSVAALLVLRLATTLFAPSNNFRVAALLAAMLFALHPAQTEAVTYICGRSTSLMAMFYLAALCAACSERLLYRDWLAPLLFAAALMSKETAWPLPFAVLLINAFRGISWRDNLRRVSPLCVMLLLMGLAIVATPAYRRMLAHSLSIRSLADNLALQVDGWFYLISQPLLLLRTNIDPDLATQPVFDSGWWARLTGLLLLIAVTWWQRRSWIGFALCWLFLHLLPTNSLLPRNDIANDRQLYLALIGPAIWCARACIDWRSRRASFAVAFALLVAFALTTQMRNRDYRDEISLWRATARLSPDKARVWNNLGYAYQQQGFSIAAINAYRRALIHDANYTRARINLRLLDSSEIELPHSIPEN